MPCNEKDGENIVAAAPVVVSGFPGKAVGPTVALRSAAVKNN